MRAPLCRSAASASIPDAAVKTGGAQHLRLATRARPTGCGRRCVHRAADGCRLTSSDAAVFGSTAAIWIRLGEDLQCAPGFSGPARQICTGLLGVNLGFAFIASGCAASLSDQRVPSAMRSAGCAVAKPQCCATKLRDRLRGAHSGMDSCRTLKVVAPRQTTAARPVLQFCMRGGAMLACKLTGSYVQRSDLP